jgi:hypothetical protein
MGFVYLEHGITVYHADALSIHDNFIAECGNCIELRGWGQASKITDNLMGAGYKGYSIFAQNFGGLLINANNIFPRGTSSVTFKDVAKSTITGNRFHGFYPGMLVFEGACSENMISSNHFLRDNEPWTPLIGVDNGLDDQFGILRISGSNNSIIANHISETVSLESIKPADKRPVIIRLISGNGNYIASNHIVAMAELDAEASEACFAAQVNALTGRDRRRKLDVVHVLVEEKSEENIVLDSGSEKQVILDRKRNAFRATPELEAM